VPDFCRGPALPRSTPDDWIPLGEAAGFVVTHDDPLPRAARTPPGTVKGYFVIRRASAWLRVDSVPDYDLQKAALAR
jgi:hypothetical protein